MFSDLNASHRNRKLLICGLVILAYAERITSTIIAGTPQEFETE